MSNPLFAKTQTPSVMQLVPLSLRKNFSWTLAGNVIYAGSQWGMLVVLAKLGTPEMVGQFTLGLAITAPVLMFANLNLRAVQATDTRNVYRFGDYLALRLVTTVLAFVVIIGIVFVTEYRLEMVLVSLAVGLAKSFEAISDVFYGLLQRHERMARIAISMMVKGPISLILFSLGVYLTGNVLGGVVGLVISWGLVLFAYDVRSGVRILYSVQADVPKGRAIVRPRWELPTLRRLAWLALPLGFVMMLISANTNIPRYFIEHYLGEHQLGIFAAMTYLMVAGQMIVAALGQSSSPRLAAHYATRNHAAFSALLLKLVGIGALLGIAGLLVAAFVGNSVLTLLYRAEYAEHVDVFLWLMIAAGINYVASFMGYAMTAARQFRAQIFVFILVACTTLVLCLWLIPIYGMLGGAIALVISAAVQAASSLLVVLYALRVSQTATAEPEPA